MSESRFRVVVSDAGPVECLQHSAGWTVSQPLPLVDATSLVRHLRLLGCRAEVAARDRRLEQAVAAAGNEVTFERSSAGGTKVLLHQLGELPHGHETVYLVHRRYVGWRRWVAWALGLL